ncbi:MAG: hypothetical protein AAFR21_06085 [Pseudomonadota bacterium]
MAQGYAGKKMTGYELHELLAANRELISDTWNFFLSVHLAVFGIVYIASGRIHRAERLVLIIAYLGFMFMNYMAQMDNYKAYSVLIEQISVLPDTMPDAAVAKALANSDPAWIVTYLMPVYAAASLASSLIIMLINRGRG